VDEATERSLDMIVMPFNVASTNSLIQLTVAIPQLPSLSVGLGRLVVETIVPGSERVTGNPNLTLVSVGCCIRVRVCLDGRSETQIFVDPAAFLVTNPSRLPKSRFFQRLAKVRD
jgi:hypothetical protein